MDSPHRRHPAIIGVCAIALVLVGGYALAKRGFQPAGPFNPVAKGLNNVLGNTQAMRTSPGGGVSVFEAARGKNAYIGAIAIEPWEKIGFHRDPDEEYLIIMEGGGTLTLDGTQHQLGEGDVVYMRANSEVAFVNGANQTTALQVFAGPGSADKFASWGDKPAGAIESMRAEGPTNLNGIRTAEKAYHAEWDTFTSVGWTPARLGGTKQVDFAPTRGWSSLGWMADGKVRCRYKVDSVAGPSSSTDSFDAWAECDVDGDGVNSVYHANRASKSRMMTPNSVY